MELERERVILNTEAEGISVVSGTHLTTPCTTHYCNCDFAIHFPDISVVSKYTLDYTLYHALNCTPYHTLK